MKKILNYEEEIHEGLKKINWLQKKLVAKHNGVENQIAELEKQIEEISDKATSKPTREERIQLLARLCLLSELSSVVGFDRMIKAREKFLDMFPQHFKEYLTHLEDASWEITWSGCLGCIHFAGKCALNLTPIEAPSSDNRLKRSCPSREQKSVNL